MHVESFFVERPPWLTHGEDIREGLRILCKVGGGRNLFKLLFLTDLWVLSQVDILRNVLLNRDLVLCSILLSGVSGCVVSAMALTFSFLDFFFEAT